MSSDLETRCRYPYLTGVYLALNAIPDAYLVVDGPNCVFFRSAQIQGNHDWWSDLVRSDGLHRVADTDCTTERAAIGDSRLLLERLQEVARLPDAKVILLSAMAMVSLTGKQYDRILSQLNPRPKVPVLFVPPGSLSGDWLAGYAAVMDTLARGLSLKRMRRDPRQVAIVGYFWDRNEADHRGNLAELRRLLAGLDLRLTSCWLSGTGVRGLQDIAKAQTILSFPYARAAARILARRTGATLVECDLPVGLEATCAWLREVSRATRRQDRAEAMIEEELSDVVPRLQWLLPFALQGRRALLLGDAHLMSALTKALLEVGVDTALRVFWNDPRPGTPTADARTVVGPSHRELAQQLGRIMENEGVDLALSNSDGLLFLLRQQTPPAVVEIGYPSYHTHFFHDAPFMGFRGMLGLIQRLSNSLAQKALHDGARRQNGGLLPPRKKLPLP